MDLRKLVLYKDLYDNDVTVNELVKKIESLEERQLKMVSAMHSLEYRILIGFTQKELFELIKYKSIDELSKAEYGAFTDKFKVSVGLYHPSDRCIKSMSQKVIELCEEWGMYIAGELKEDE